MWGQEGLRKRQLRGRRDLGFEDQSEAYVEPRGRSTSRGQLGQSLVVGKWGTVGSRGLDKAGDPAEEGAGYKERSVGAMVAVFGWDLWLL